MYCADEQVRITFETKAINRFLDAGDLYQIRSGYLRRRIMAGMMGKGEMTMIDKQTVQERLDSIDTMLRLLRQYQTMSLEEFSKNELTLHAALYEFQTSLEAMTDIGNHLIAALSLKKPGDRAEIFTILAQAGIIPEALAKELIKAVGMRNIIVHGYRGIIVEVVYQTICKDLGQIEEFCRCVVEYLEQHREEKG
jgi:uncharacterized protein YutE (UPF0331/DUF86 family)